MIVKTLFATAGLVVVLGVGIAFAAPPLCNGATALTATQIQTVLAGNYACIGTRPNLQNNELHQGAATGSIQEYGTGASGSQPAAVIGSYVIAPSGNGGHDDTITYSYTGGGTYQYALSGTSSPYSFCEISPGTNTYSVTVQSAHC